MAEWSKAPILKIGRGNSLVGSNPTPPAMSRGLTYFEVDCQVFNLRGGVVPCCCFGVCSGWVMGSGLAGASVLIFKICYFGL